MIDKEIAIRIKSMREMTLVLKVLKSMGEKTRKGECISTFINNYGEYSSFAIGKTNNKFKSKHGLSWGYANQAYYTKVGLIPITVNQFLKTYYSPPIRYLI